MITNSAVKAFEKYLKDDEKSENTVNIKNPYAQLNETKQFDYVCKTAVIWRLLPDYSGFPFYSSLSLSECIL